ncbi:hypothetical protein NDU88_003640 [Pleurodeles waltl]|uniref:Uncharacterized protein n=1 Tax=Pleurodeles waltl TaxID=8319 RepID=A0AAV7KVF3_PLEWA|nr:hypothetical protein NDU88_003640 [Pleurodeles waltl]
MALVGALADRPVSCYPELLRNIKWGNSRNGYELGFTELRNVTERDHTVEGLVSSLQTEVKAPKEHVTCLKSVVDMLDKSPMVAENHSRCSNLCFQCFSKRAEGANAVSFSEFTICCEFRARGLSTVFVLERVHMTQTRTTTQCPT